MLPDWSQIQSAAELSSVTRGTMSPKTDGTAPVDL